MSTIQRWSNISIAGFCLFFLVLIAMHCVHPEFDPSTRFISEYILGDFGWILNIAITGNLIGCISLLMAIYYGYPPPFRSRTVLLSLGLATGCIFSNFFPVDVYGKATSLSGHIHHLGGFIGTLAGLLFMFVFIRRLKKLDLLKGNYRILIFLLVIAVVLFLGMLIFLDYISGFLGIVQRIYSSCFIVSFIVIANGIRTGAIVP
jgi:hypothetical protein